MINATLKSARNLIQERKYSEARVLLETISHDPTAQKWLAKLDEIDPLPSFDLSTPKLQAQAKENRRSNRAWFPLAIMLLVGVVLGFLAGWLVFEADLSTNSIPVVEQTQTAASATLTHLDLLLRAQLTGTLVAYCESITDKSQGQCRRWAEAVLEVKLPEVNVCDREFNWITDNTSFGWCLLTQGISIMGSEPLIAPVPLENLSDDDFRLIGYMTAYCSESEDEGYCGLWAVLTYMEHSITVQQCDAQRGEFISPFFSCLEGNSIVP